jgi:hypothetical protein
MLSLSGVGVVSAGLTSASASGVRLSQTGSGVRVGVRVTVGLAVWVGCGVAEGIFAIPTNGAPGISGDLVMVTEDILSELLSSDARNRPAKTVTRIAPIINARLSHAHTGINRFKKANILKLLIDTSNQCQDTILTEGD